MAITDAASSSSEEALQTTFASLDPDAVRSVASALLVNTPVRSPNCADVAASYRVSRNRNAPPVIALASTCKFHRDALTRLVFEMQRQHRDRRAELSCFCAEVLGTSLTAMDKASTSASPGVVSCAGCGRIEPALHGVFRADGESPLITRVGQLPNVRRGLPLDDDIEHDEDPEEEEVVAAEDAEGAAAEGAAVEDAEPEPVPETADDEDENSDGSFESEEEEVPAQLQAGGEYCAHCWRAAYGLMMRPSAVTLAGEATEQTWEAPVEDGDWRYVEDFSHGSVDSPLLAPEEFCLETQHHFGAVELYRALQRSGYALRAVGPLGPLGAELAPAVLNAALDADAAAARSEVRGRVQELLHTRLRERPFLLADLLSSGFGYQLLSLDLSGSSLDDAGLGLLARALVGNGLLVRYLALSRNPITDDGLEDFAGVLAPRPFDLMLPLLRWFFVILEAPPEDAPAEAFHVAGACFGSRGAVALAAALDGLALPSLELLCCGGEFVADLNGDGRPDTDGYLALQASCDARQVVFTGAGPELV